MQISYCKRLLNFLIYICVLHIIKQEFVLGYLYPYESEAREVKCLNGLWNFKISPVNRLDIGIEEAWFAREFSEIGDFMQMPVPSSFNDITTNKTIRDYVGWVWYQRSFYAPTRWLQDELTKVFLHFGSVHYYAVVYLNGKKIGEHEGGHIPFQLELPTSILTTKNLLTVAVNNTLTPHTVPQGKVTFSNDTTRYPMGFRLYSHDFDYFDYAGINRPVLLFTTPYVLITDIKLKTSIQQENGLVQFSVLSTGQGQCRVRLFNQLGSAVAQHNNCNGILVVQNAQFWWPANTCGKTPGYLYSLEVVLESHFSTNDIYRLPVGIRTVNWTNNNILINGQINYLRGFGMHEDANVRGRGFDYTVMSRDMNLIQWIGANSFRTSHYPYADETLNQADALGLLVIVEVPACSLNGFGEQLYSRHQAYLQEMISVHGNRPSVIMWSLANEPVSNTEKASQYFRNLSKAAKEYDPTRPITIVTSQPVANETSVVHVDVICVNRYRGWYSDGGLTDLIPYQVVNEITTWHQLYNRPVIVSEYGAGSISGLHTQPESMWSEDYQAELHSQHFTAFDELRHKGRMAGEMVWNFIDFNTPQEYFRPGRCSKGLFTRERQPKLVAHTVRKRYLSLKTC